MKKKLTLILLLSIFLQSLFSDSMIIEEFETKNLTTVIGSHGYNFLQLKQDEYEPSPQTDLLMHFNDVTFTDEANNYLIQHHYNNISNVEKELGVASSYFFKDKGIVITSNGESLFTAGRIIGDFTIEFWVYPTIISEDTTLFSWKGVNKVEEDFIPQTIKCYLENRKVVWEFNNFFVPVDFSNYSISLKSKTKLIPNKWNHYLIRYKSDNGLIEFLLNGIPESVMYTTKTKKEETNVYPPYVGNFSKNEIFIGERLRGFIDELRISESFIENPVLSKFTPSGSFFTKIYDINGEDIILKDMIFNDTIKPETSITYDFRLSKSPFLPNDNVLPWISSENIPKDLGGRYIQFRGDLFSNGDNSISPMLQNIEIKWDEIIKPPAPLVITSKAGIESLSISWNPVKHYDIDGYYIYYGDQSNKYTEMIDVGKNTSYNIINLKSKKIYYYSIRSYIKNKKSDYSFENFNRPK